MIKKFLAECSEKTTKEAYNLYLDVYTSWGSSNPLNFEEFKRNYTGQNDFENTFAFFDKKKFIGYGCIMANYPQHRRLDIGYAVEKNSRKKGFGDLICKELINFARNKFNPNIIIAEVFGENKGSEKILLKNGFKKAGEIPKYNQSLSKPRKLSFYFLELS